MDSECGRRPSREDDSRGCKQLRPIQRGPTNFATANRASKPNSTRSNTKIINFKLSHKRTACNNQSALLRFKNNQERKGKILKNLLILYIGVQIFLSRNDEFQGVECTTTTVNEQRVHHLNPAIDLYDTFSFLVDPITKRVTPPSEYMDFENIYAPNESYKRNITAQARNYQLIKAFDFANYFRSDYWHYSDPQKLQLSGGPAANETECSRQINWLLTQLTRPKLHENVLFEAGEQHVNLMTLIDSYGKPDAATFSGHNLWVGSYHECTHVRLNMTKFEQEQCLSNPSSSLCANIGGIERSNHLIRGRYCMGKARDKDWPQNDNYKPQVTYKIGLCLPETCQTSSMSKNRLQLDQLMKVALATFWRDRLNLTDIYCLPDPRSPIRQLDLAGYIVLWFMIIWVSLVLVATIIYSCYERNELRLKDLSAEASKIKSFQDASESFIPPKLNDATTNATTNLLIVDNARNQQQQREGVSFDTPELSISSRHRLRNSPTIIKILKSISLVENNRKFRTPPSALREPDSARTSRINLNPLDCIKCFCCIFVIFGHIVFVHMQHMNNITHTIELSYHAATRILIALFNFVDTFFIISGMLTSYFIFKRFNQKTFANPLIWIYISFMRLLRLSPVYILVFWFTKTLTVHLYDGPLWDYATDKHSIKGLCANDHWWKSLLYLGNWATMQPLCILPAWSIIVDSQYSLIMPAIIFLVMKYRKYGYTSIVLAIVASTMHMSWQLANQSAVKTSDMAKIRLHVYPLISRFAAEFYNAAFNRIGPVAIGIVGGHALYLYDVGKIRRWPVFMRGLSFKIVLMTHLFILILPTLGKLTDNPASRDDTDLTIFILSNSSIKPIWSLVNSVLILRLITDLRQYSIVAQLMSHNLWHCLGKLCFISYLIHYEIILVLLKSRQEGLVDPNWSNAGREFSYAFLISTGLSYCIYILYEAPMNNLIMCAIRVEDQMAARTKPTVTDPSISLVENGTTKSSKPMQNGTGLYAHENSNRNFVSSNGISQQARDIGSSINTKNNIKTTSND